MVRVVITYKGQVQGVGFRFTVRSIARDFPEIAGTVENLPSGNVELVAEGPSARIDALHAAICRQMGGYISSFDKTVSQDLAGLNGFSIVL